MICQLRLLTILKQNNFMYTPEELRDYILKALDDIQAEDIKLLEVTEISSFTDYMIIATGRSDRHVKAVADTVLEQLQEKGIKAIGKEGFETAEWVLLDFDDAIVHVMRQQTREFYDLEGLWGEEVRKLVNRHREETVE